MAVVLSSAIEVEDGNILPRRAPRRWVHLPRAVRRHQLPQHPIGPGIQRPMALAPVVLTHTDIGWVESGRGMTAFRRENVDGLNALPPDFGKLFLQLNLTSIEVKVSAGLRAKNMEEAHPRRDFATLAAAVGEVNREVS